MKTFLAGFLSLCGLLLAWPVYGVISCPDYTIEIGGQPVKHKSILFRMNTQAPKDFTKGCYPYHCIDSSGKLMTDIAGRTQALLNLGGDIKGQYPSFEIDKFVSGDFPVTIWDGTARYTIDARDLCSQSIESLKK